jgi:hypothetical protein
MEAENYPLDDASINLLAELKAALDRQILATNSQIQGALILFIRQQGLTGNWRVAENGRELVRDPAPVPAQS